MQIKILVYANKFARLQALKIKAKAETNKPDLKGEIIGHKRLKVCVVEKSLSCIACSYINYLKKLAALYLLFRG